MADKKWNDWSEFLKKGHVERDPTEEKLHKALNLPKGDISQKGGEKVTREQLIKEALDIVKQTHLSKGVRQATDEELFGHLVMTEEQIAELERQYQEKINDFYKAARAPIGDGSQVKKDDWANGKSYNEQMELTEEERQDRNMSTDER